MSETTAAPRFALRELSALGYTNGFSHWHYRLRDTPLSAALAPDFFEDAQDMLASGDMVTITGGGCGAQCVVQAGCGREPMRLVVLARTA